MGTRVFKTPVTELSSRVWAIENRKEGTKLAKNPEPISGSQSFLLTWLRRIKAAGTSTMAAATMRSEPTSFAESAVNPFLMRMNELPQMMDRMMSSTQPSVLLFMWVQYSERNWRVNL